jgi:hypothetical protein
VPSVAVPSGRLVSVDGSVVGGTVVLDSAPDVLGGAVVEGAVDVVASGVDGGGEVVAGVVAGVVAVVVSTPVAPFVGSGRTAR